MVVKNIYEIAYEIDLRCYPNYSFEIGDIDGDGRSEIISINQNGNRLRATNLENRLLFEKRLTNNGNWGTVLICIADVDGDGREEVIVPNMVPASLEARIVAINAEGNEIGEHGFGTAAKDDYGIRVPLLAPVRHGGEAGTKIIAALANGCLVCLDCRLEEEWRKGGFRPNFGHEFYIEDIDSDGMDEIAFCTCDHINAAYSRYGSNVGELVLADHDGSIILRRDIHEYWEDTHFDDIAFADFRGSGRVEMLVEKGILLDPYTGEIIWNKSDRLDHGQWIAHTADPMNPGRLIFITELWGDKGKSACFGGNGEQTRNIQDLPLTKLDSILFPGWQVLPTRCHIVQWSEDEEPEFFFAEQACSPTSHDCFNTRHFSLRCYFLDLAGNLIGVLPFEDAQIEGYWYNGEVHSRVADVDGDGRQEIVFPRQDGRVMVIKKMG